MESVFIYTVIVGMISAAMIVIGADIYDSREILKKRQYLAHPYASRYRSRPLISIIIATNNSEIYIERCLKSVLRSSYRKIDVLVIDGASEDNTKAIVRRIIEQYPQKSIALVARRSKLCNLNQLAVLIKKYCHGQLVMQLDVAQVLDKRSLALAANHFNADPNIGILLFKNCVRVGYRTVGLLQQYESLIGYRTKKFASVSNSDFDINGNAKIYKREVLTKFLGANNKKGDYINIMNNRKFRTFYAYDSLVYVDPLATFYDLLRQRYRLQLSRFRTIVNLRKLFFTRKQDNAKFLTWFRLPFALLTGVMAVFVPIMLSYFIYLAIKLHEPRLFIISCIVLGFSLLLAIWGDEYLLIRHKAVYSLLMPITFGLFFMMTFIQILVIFRGMIPERQIREKPLNLSI